VVEQDFLALSATELLAQCEVDTFRASGPGGQHRNKTDSAVRVRHRPTGLTAQAVERRSQHQNLERALERLRATIAIEVRRPVETDGYQPPPNLRRILPGSREQIRGSHPQFWNGVQALLDLFVACGLSVGDTATHLGLSTGQLSRLITGEPELMRAVNAMRIERGMRPLRG
jgi:hypothetical protein